MATGATRSSGGSSSSSQPASIGTTSRGTANRSRSIHCKNDGGRAVVPSLAVESSNYLARGEQHGWSGRERSDCDGRGAGDWGGNRSVPGAGWSGGGDPRPGRRGGGGDRAGAGQRVDRDGVRRGGRGGGERGVRAGGGEVRRTRHPR